MFAVAETNSRQYKVTNSYVRIDWSSKTDGQCKAGGGTGIKDRPNVDQILNSNGQSFYWWANILLVDKQFI